MKKLTQTRKLKAFSLAEALITLLIVSLVTLASVPVITKKKRVMKSNGLIMCTRNSADTIVSWQKGVTDVGVIDDPDSWDIGCDVSVPSDAQNVSVTVIGSGGGGASAESTAERVVYTPNHGSFTPAEDGLYRIVVVGGGGGGGQGLQRRGKKCNGGSGASGSFFIGDAILKANTKYILAAGSGGARANSTGPSCSRNVKKAEAGGSSSFYTADDGGAALKIIASGGNFAEGCSISGSGGFGICKNNCGGGTSAGINGQKVTIGSTTLSGASIGNKYNGVKVIYYLQGNTGLYGGCASSPPISLRTGGTGFNGYPYSIPVTGSGAGGNGSSYYTPSTHTNGSSGYVALYKIKRLHGQGGEAAEPKDIVFPHLRGLIKVDIASRTEPDTNGTMTTFELYDANGRKTRTIAGYGGSRGTKAEIEAPTDGENSYRTLDGGGKAGTTCTQSGSVPIYVTTGGTTKTVCSKLVCSINQEKGFPSGWGISQGKPASTAKKVNEFVAKFEYAFPTYASYWNSTTFTNYLKTISEKFFATYHYKTVEGVSSLDSDKFKDGKDTYFVNTAEIETNISDFANYNESITAQGVYYPKLTETGRCFTDTTNKLYYDIACDENSIKSVVLSASSSNIVGYTTNYECPDAGDAELHAFGAGGGGGYAHDVPGFAGKGGKGAQGAVIIEW